IIEEFGGARQDLSYKRDAIVGFHRLDLDIHIHITSPEQQLARWSASAAHTGQHGLIVRVENERCDEFPQAAYRSVRLSHRLEELNAPPNPFSRRLEGSIFTEPGDDSLKFLL